MNEPFDIQDYMTNGVERVVSEALKASQMETIEEAAAVHGVDADELVRTLNEKLAEASAE